MEGKDPNLTSQKPAIERPDDDLPPPAVLPKWVPILIGLILVVMATLAIWTGLKYRNEAFRKPIVKLPQRQYPMSGAGAPGEPTPGASRVSHDSAGEMIPQPNPQSDETSKFTITNEGGTIASTTRVSASRGMLLDVEPETALVYINDKPIGDARQFASADSMYEFADEGSYTVRLVEEGFADIEYIVSVTPDARSEVAIIRVELQPK